MKIAKSIMLLLTVGFSTISHAQWFEDLIVTQVQTFPNGEKIAIYVESGLDSTCSGGAAVYVEAGKAGVTNKGVTDAKMLAMSALMANRKLNVSVLDVTSPCYVDRLRIE